MDQWWADVIVYFIKIWNAAIDAVLASVDGSRLTWNNLTRCGCCRFPG